MRSHGFYVRSSCWDRLDFLGGGCRGSDMSDRLIAAMNIGTATEQHARHGKSQRGPDGVF